MFALQRLGVFASDPRGWGDGTLGIQITLSPDGGKQPQANQRHDYDTDGLPAENLVTRGSNQGHPQRPYAGPGKLFLDG